MPDEFPKTEADWNAATDARTLAEAGVINDDPKRLAAARKAASKLVEQESARVQGLEIISRG